MDGDFVVSAWGGPLPVPGGTLECTDADIKEFGTKEPKLKGTDTYRWTFIDSVLAEVADDRTRVTWGDPDGNATVDGDGNLTFVLDEGDPEVNVTLSLPGSASRTQRLNLDGLLLKVEFVNGTATIAIATVVPRRMVFKNSDAFRMANTLTIRVNAVKL